MLAARKWTTTKIECEEKNVQRKNIITWPYSIVAAFRCMPVFALLDGFRGRSRALAIIFVFLFYSLFLFLISFFSLHFCCVSVARPPLLADGCGGFCVAIWIVTIAQPNRIISMFCVSLLHKLSTEQTTVCACACLCGCVLHSTECSKTISYILLSLRIRSAAIMYPVSIIHMCSVDWRVKQIEKCKRNSATSNFSCSSRTRVVGVVVLYDIYPRVTYGNRLGWSVRQQQSAIPHLAFAYMCSFHTK